MARRLLVPVVALATIACTWTVASEAATVPVPKVVSFGGRAPGFDPDRARHVDGVAGRTADLVVDFTGLPEGDYGVRDKCDGDTADKVVTVTADPASRIATIPMASLPSPQVCRVVFHSFPEGGEFDHPLYLHLLSPTYRVANYQNLSGAAFYPRVPGHPDLWRARFLANAPTKATIRVRNSAGRIVYTGVRYSKRVRPEWFSPDQWEVLPTWNGRTTAGSLVRIGTYRITIHAESSLATGSAKIGPVRAVVKAGRRTLTASQRKIGSLATRATGGGCGAQPQPNGWMWLNCSFTSGRGYASASWVFTVPAGAKITRWSIGGGAGGDDRAGQGSVRKTITRLAPTKVRLRLRVDGKRSWLAFDSRVTYTYLK